MWRIIFYEGKKAVLIHEDDTSKIVSIDWPEVLEDLIMMAFDRKQDIIFIRERTEKEAQTMEPKNSDHFYTQLDTYIKDEIWGEHGVIDLFLGRIYHDMDENLLCFQEASVDEFKDVMKDAIIDYINNCEARHGGKY